MKKILFVCTGNTCRSPMAACMLNAMGADVCAVSAGMRTMSGDPASDGAMRAMEKRGLSLAAHRSQPVTHALLDEVDLVAGMTPGHVEMLRVMWPKCRTPMVAFEDPPVFDPYGGGDSDYERAACDIQRQLPALIAHMSNIGGENK